MYYRYNEIDILKETISPYDYIRKANIFLIRHGESTSNALQNSLKNKGKLLTEDLKMEDATIQLSENGKKQAIDLGKYLYKYMNNNNLKKEETLVLISPFTRVRETFELANESLKFDLSSNIFVLNSLAEQSYGAFHMISREIKEELYNKIYSECQRSTISYFKPQFLGESPSDVSNRLWNVIYFIKDYIENKNIKNVFIFAHRNVNKCMLMNLLNLPPEFYDDFKINENSSIINIKNGKYNTIV